MAENFHHSRTFDRTNILLWSNVKKLWLRSISTATKPRKVQDNIEFIDDSTDGREGSLDNKSQEAKNITENKNDVSMCRLGNKC